MRTVFCADALPWLEGAEVPEHASFITSLPDVSEVPHLSLEAWKDWFVLAAEKVMRRTSPEGVAIFYQTDIKKAGTWVDKGYLVQKAAERSGLALLWHKVVCRVSPGNVTHGRPAFAHLLAFSRNARVNLAHATADVLPITGEMTWVRAMGVEACLAACRYVLNETPTRTVVDPFCGLGTALAIANALGLEAVGVELSRRRARQARALAFEWKEGRLARQPLSFRPVLPL